jgi:hypothetical protein
MISLVKIEVLGQNLKPYAREGFPQATHTGPAGSSHSRSQAYHRVRETRTV